MRFRFPRKFKWPSLATIIAVLALIVASLEYVTPLVQGFYAKPQLVVVTDGWYVDGYSGATFKVLNVGNVPATKIELGLIMLTDQRLTIEPYLPVTVTDEKSAVLGEVDEESDKLQKDVRIETERLLPGESFRIIVSPTSLRPKKKARIARREKIEEMLRQAGINVFRLPILRFARCAEGAATHFSTSETQDQIDKGELTPEWL